MKVKGLTCILVFLLGSVGMLRAAEPSVTFSLKAMQMNIWKGGSMVEGAVGMIADEIIHSDADLIFLNELRNFQGENFILYMVKELRRRGHIYYGEKSSLAVGVLSRFPIESQEVVFPCAKNEKGAILRVVMAVGGHKVAAYAAHLDYRHYACYLPRGYDGSSWEKMDAPVVDETEILAMNRKSYREEAISTFLRRSQSDIAQGFAVLLAGDFNEPSHLDWTVRTKNLWEHNGAIVNWSCSSMLYEKGFRDAYRTVYPNPVTHPGFTFPAGNRAVAVDKLTWAPEADERDRIDFIYYYPASFLAPKKAWVVGPTESVVRGVIKKEKGKDRFLRSGKQWPTDNKAVMNSFSVNSGVN